MRRLIPAQHHREGQLFAVVFHKTVAVRVLTARRGQVFLRLVQIAGQLRGFDIARRALGNEARARSRSVGRAEGCAEGIVINGAGHGLADVFVVKGRLVVVEDQHRAVGRIADGLKRQVIAGGKIRDHRGVHTAGIAIGHVHLTGLERHVERILAVKQLHQHLVEGGLAVRVILHRVKLDHARVGVEARIAIGAASDVGLLIGHRSIVLHAVIDVLGQDAQHGEVCKLARVGRRQGQVDRAFVRHFDAFVTVGISAAFLRVEEGEREGDVLRGDGLPIVPGHALAHGERPGLAILRRIVAEQRRVIAVFIQPDGRKLRKRAGNHVKVIFAAVRSQDFRRRTDDKYAVLFRRSRLFGLRFLRSGFLRCGGRLGGLLHRCGGTSRQQQAQDKQQGKQFLFHFSSPLSSIIFDHFSIRQLIDAIRDRIHHWAIMRNEQERQTAFLSEFLKQTQDLRLRGHIEHGGRLIRNQQLRLQRQRSRYQHALRLPAGKLTRPAMQQLLLQSDRQQQFSRTFPCLARIFYQTMCAQRFGDRVLRALQGIERGVRLLRNELDAPMHLRGISSPSVIERRAVPSESSPVRAFRTAQNLGDGGLSRAAGADNTHPFPRLHKKVNTVEHAFLPETLLQAADLKHPSAPFRANRPAVAG